MKVAGVVRLSSVYENPTDALGHESAAFWQNGVKIPTEMVPTEILTPDKEAGVAA